MDPRTLVIIICAYLIGSIPFSQIITRWRAGLDLRAVGEGNVGSRNVWHVVGPQWGVLAAALDGVKGFLVCWAVSAFGSPLDVALAGIAVILGHQFPIFLRGRGGKGLITGLGVLLFLSPLSTLAGVIVLGVATLVLRDFNLRIAVVVVALIILPVLFRQPLWISAYTVGLALLSGLKKWLDHSHDMRVWANSPWQDTATPGLQQPARPAGDDPSQDVR